MSLPSELQPTKHTFVPDEFNNGATCRQCGEALDFGNLHPEPEPTPEVHDTTGWEAGDICYDPANKSLFVVKGTGFGRVEFLPLVPSGSWAQLDPPRDAVLLVRNGEAVRG